MWFLCTTHLRRCVAVDAVDVVADAVGNFSAHQSLDGRIDAFLVHQFLLVGHASQIDSAVVDAVVLNFPPSNLQHPFSDGASDDLLPEVVSLKLLLALALAASFSLPPASAARTPRQLPPAPSSFLTRLPHHLLASDQASTNLPSSIRDLAPYS